MVCAAYTSFFKCYGIERIARKPLVFAINIKHCIIFFSYHKLYRKFKQKCAKPCRKDVVIWWLRQCAVGNMQIRTVSSVCVTNKVRDTTTGFKHLGILAQTKEASSVPRSAEN